MVVVAAAAAAAVALGLLGVPLSAIPTLGLLRVLASRGLRLLPRRGSRQGGNLRCRCVEEMEDHTVLPELALLGRLPSSLSWRLWAPPPPPPPLSPLPSLCMPLPADAPLLTLCRAWRVRLPGEAAAPSEMREGRAWPSVLPSRVRGLAMELGVKLVTRTSIKPPRSSPRGVVETRC